MSDSEDVRQRIVHPGFPQFVCLYEHEYDMWIAMAHDRDNEPSLCYRARTPLGACAGLTRVLKREEA